MKRYQELTINQKINVKGNSEIHYRWFYLNPPCSILSHVLGAYKMYRITYNSYSRLRDRNTNN